MRSWTFIMQSYQIHNGMGLKTLAKLFYLFLELLGKTELNQYTRKMLPILNKNMLKILSLERIQYIYWIVIG